MRSLNTGTEDNRAQIERDVQQFLNSGKAITEVPVGIGKDAARNMQWKAMAIESAKKAGLK